MEERNLFHINGLLVLNSSTDKTPHEHEGSGLVEKPWAASEAPGHRARVLAREPPWEEVVHVILILIQPAGSHRVH